jgi:hypothetical protein
VGRIEKENRVRERTYQGGSHRLFEMKQVRRSTSACRAIVVKGFMGQSIRMVNFFNEFGD